MIQPDPSTKHTKGEQTRQTIINGAYTSFLKNGYHGTSMRAIAKAAGIALGGIYNHFESKEEIFQAVIITHHPLLKLFPKLIEADLNEADSAEALLTAAARLIFSEIRQEPQLFDLMFIELIELDGGNLSTLLPVLQPSIATFLQMLLAYQPDWRVESPIVFVRSFIGLILGIYVTDRFAPKALGTATETDLDPYLEIYFHGLFKA